MFISLQLARNWSYIPLQICKTLNTDSQTPTESPQPKTPKALNPSSKCDSYGHNPSRQPKRLLLADSRLSHMRELLRLYWNWLLGLGCFRGLRCKSVRLKHILRLSLEEFEDLWFTVIFKLSISWLWRPPLASNGFANREQGPTRFEGFWAF